MPRYCPRMRWPTGRLQRVVLLVAAAALCLAGCSHPPPKAGSVPSDSPTPTSSSPSPTPATPEEQVEAAVRAYYAELTRAAQTNDTSKLKTLTTKGCPCYRTIEAIDKSRNAGRATPDAAWTVRSIRVHDIEDGSAIAEVKYTVDSYRVMNRSGEEITSYPRSDSHVDLSLVRSGSGWIIGNLFDLEG